MLFEREGRVFTKRTEQEWDLILREMVEGLSSEEREALEWLIGELRAGHLEVLEWLEKNKYKRKPVSMEQFLDDDYYLGRTTQNLYPELRKNLIEIVDNGPYRQVILTGAIGFGKTTSVSLLMARLLYELSCLRFPQVQFGLMAGADIVVALISKNLQLARSVLRRPLEGRLILSPYFKEHFWPRVNKDEMRFPGRIKVVNSSAFAERILGMDVIGGAMDEVNFFGEFRPGMGGKNDMAMNVFDSLVRRVKSRFMRAGGDLPGMVVVVSSAGHKGSFLDQHIKKVKDDPYVFVRDYAIWDVKPKEYFSGRKFWVLVGGGRLRSRILTEEEAREFQKNEEILVENGARLIQVPEEFREDFENNIEAAIRDIAGISVSALNPFIHRMDKVERNIVSEWRHPFNVVEYVYGEGPLEVLWDEITVVKTRRLRGGFVEHYREPKRGAGKGRWAHMDIGLTGDSLGLAMGYIDGWVEVMRRGKDMEVYTEMAPLIVVDFVLRVKPGKEPIYLPEIRALLYEFMKNGFRLIGFSTDQFQSAEMRQQMAAKIGEKNVHLISVDRKTDPYEYLKAALYDGRVKMYRYEPLLEELERLEFDALRNKIDHPKGGSKDVADALAGMVYGLATRARRGVGSDYWSSDTDEFEELPGRYQQVDSSVMEQQYETGVVYSGDRVYGRTLEDVVKRGGGGRRGGGMLIIG